jgi:predicted TIM-barrel fold metal-dependent hydrolase
MAADAPERLTYWVRERGMAGMRIFAARSTMGQGSDDWLADSKTFPAWEAAEKLGIPVCIQTRFGSIGALRVLLERFPGVRIIFDHMAHPPVEDGPPYAAAAAFFDLARHPNLYLKLTELNFQDLARGNAAPRAFIERTVDFFGADHIAWGSNFPASEGTLRDLRDHALQELSFLPERDQRAILCETALALYPSLRRGEPQ